MKKLSESGGEESDNLFKSGHLLGLDSELETVLTAAY